MNKPSLITCLQSLLRRGLWPFTADPIPPGLYVFGTPAPDTPLLITVNSRHTVGRLRRVLTPLGVRLLVVDSGGVDVHSALAVDHLSWQEIKSTLQHGTMKDETVAICAPQVAILPLPVWEKLAGQDEEKELGGWQIEPGPVDARALPEFLAHDRQLTEGMKRRQLPVSDRLHLTLAHSGLFMLLASGPLLLFARQVWAIVIVLTLLIALLWAVPAPHLLKGWAGSNRLVYLLSLFFIIFVISQLGNLGLLATALLSACFVLLAWWHGMSVNF